VFLGAEVCLRLPSDSTSRWTPLPLANGWQLPTPIVDFHHRVIYHARHTKKETASTGSLLNLKLKFIYYYYLRIALNRPSIWLSLLITIRNIPDGISSIDTTSRVPRAFMIFQHSLNSTDLRFVIPQFVTGGNETGLLLSSQKYTIVHLTETSGLKMNNREKRINLK
jgi:hypothetical protein